MLRRASTAATARPDAEIARALPMIGAITSSAARARGASICGAPGEPRWKSHAAGDASRAAREAS